MMELLAPAGSPEAVVAAVQNGADAVYFGFGDFNARRNAKNFTEEEAAQAVSYCHLRGVRTFLTLNTLLTDRELPAAAKVAQKASQMGFDAAIVQDLGVCEMIRQAAPDLPLHGSTQMSIHSLDGVKMAADFGIERVVLARELSQNELEYICARAPIEIETFLHGALCMSYSGQCFFSAAIGGRSGNRGLCAQPCRMQYGWGERAEEYPLSLKDVCLAQYLQQMQQMGIAGLKIEGRMKRPEYVAIVTGIYARALREGRKPTQDELSMLEQVFSRQGFTQGYFLDKTGKDMFGVRQEQQPPTQLYEMARQSYQGKEAVQIPVHFHIELSKHAPTTLAARDEMGHSVTVHGPCGEAAISRPLTMDIVAAQLGRTGGTVFSCNQVTGTLEEGTSLALSAINAMRREALEKLAQLRQAAPMRRTGTFTPVEKRKNQKKEPAIHVSCHTAQQISPALLAEKPALIYLPLEQAAENPDTIAQMQREGIPLCVTLPRIIWQRERAAVQAQLDMVKSSGMTQALCSTLDGIYLAKSMGFSVRGDYGLGVYNSETANILAQQNLLSITASFEMKLAQIRDLSKYCDVEMLAYGRFALMITQNCIVKNNTTQCSCHQGQSIVDRTGARFPVVKAFGCRNEILNSTPLFLADKKQEYENLGLAAVRLCFTIESAQDCARILHQYRTGCDAPPAEFTRGLYFRGVE